jgi:hypothetical protein
MGRDVFIGKNLVKLEQRLDELEHERFVAREPTWVSYNPKLNKQTHLKIKCLIHILKETRYELGGKYCRDWKPKDKKDKLSVW